MPQIRFANSLLAALIALATPILRSETSSDVLTLSSGEQISGRLEGRSAGFVILRLKTDDGLVERRIAPTEIARIEFSDTRASRADSPLPLEADALRRADYLGIIGEADEAILLHQIERFLANNRELEAIAHLKLWGDRFRSPKAKSRSIELLIRACVAARLPSEAAIHARRWLADHPDFQYGDSALPWAVVAEAELHANQSHRALWLSLQPIARRAGKQTPGLYRCYQIAIDACRQMGDDAYANALEAERDSSIPTPVEQPSKLAEADLVSRSDAHPTFDSTLVSNPRINLNLP